MSRFSTHLLSLSDRRDRAQVFLVGTNGSSSPRGHVFTWEAHHYPRAPSVGSLFETAETTAPILPIRSPFSPLLSLPPRRQAPQAAGQPWPPSRRRLPESGGRAQRRCLSDRAARVCVGARGPCRIRRNWFNLVASRAKGVRSEGRRW